MRGMDWKQLNDNLWILHVAGTSITLISNKQGYEVACGHIFPGGRRFRAADLAEAQEMALELVYEEANVLVKSYLALADALGGQKMDKKAIFIQKLSPHLFRH